MCWGLKEWESLAADGSFRGKRGAGPCSCSCRLCVRSLMARGDGVYSTPTATHTHKTHKGSFSPLLFQLCFLVPWGVHCMHREGSLVHLFIIMHSFEIICSVRWGCFRSLQFMCELHPCKFSDCSSWCHSPSHLLVELGIEARGHPWYLLQTPHPHRPNMHTHKYSHPLFNQSNRLRALNRYSVYGLFIQQSQPSHLLLIWTLHTHSWNVLKNLTSPDFCGFVLHGDKQVCEWHQHTLVRLSSFAVSFPFSFLCVL